MHDFARDELQIEVIQLPSYSPGLMPVEELWRWFRRDVSKNRFFRTWSELIQAAQGFERRINAIPFEVADRLVVLDVLDQKVEKLLLSA